MPFTSLAHGKRPLKSINKTEQQAPISAHISLGVEQEVQHVAVFDRIGLAL
jgi:hypothetical protein